MIRKRSVSVHPKFVLSASKSRLTVGSNADCRVRHSSLPPIRSEPADPLWSKLQSMFQQKLGTIIQDGIAEGQRFALYSNLSQNSVIYPKCDVVVTLRSCEKELAKRQCTWLVDVLKRLEPQLRVEVRFHSLTNSYALYVTAAYVSLLKGAELCHLKKELKAAYGGGQRDFAFDEAHCFQGVEEKAAFLNGMERAMVVRQLLDMLRAPRGGLRCPGPHAHQPLAEGRALITALRSARHAIIEHILPLHEADELKDLQKHWVFTTEPQPLDRIRNYFGTEIAMYFAWLGHLTTALVAPALLGAAMWLVNLAWASRGDRSKLVECDDEDGVCTIEEYETTLFSDICFVVFAFFNCVWSTAYLEHWKRRQAELAYQWGTYDLETDPLMDDPRPGFKGELGENPVNNRLEPTYPWWKHSLIRFGITYPITLLCCLFMFLAMFLLLHLQDITHQYFADSWLLFWIVYLPIIFYAILVLVAEQCYRHLALFFNELENYRTDDEYETFLITKIALFQCISAFGSLFYIAFYMNDVKKLRDTLATLLLARQFTQNAVELAAPYITERFKFWRLSYKMTRTLSERSLRLQVEKAKEFRKSRQNTTEEVSPDESEHSPLLPAPTEHKRPSSLTNEQWSPMRLRGSNFSANNSDLLSRLASPTDSAHSRLPLPEFCPTEKFVFTEAELQSLMTVYARPLDDYLEMFVQFGYVLLFSPAFPLAALFCLISNLLEIRVDAFKLCNAVQRPFGRQVRNIGAWQKAMEIMGVVGVVVNCALIGQSGLVHRLFPEMSFGGQVVLVVVLEHLVLTAKYLIDMAIPDVPMWIRVQTAKMENYRREAYKREIKMHSNRGSLSNSLVPSPAINPSSPDSNSSKSEDVKKVPTASSGRRPQVPPATPDSIDGRPPRPSIGRFVRKRAPIPGFFKHFARSHRSVTPSAAQRFAAPDDDDDLHFRPS